MASQQHCIYVFTHTS